MTRLRISDHTSVMPTHSGVLIRSDLGTLGLDGDDARLFIAAVVPLLDGSRDANEIADQLPQYARDSVLNLLDQLHDKGVLETSEDSGYLEDQAWRAQISFLRAWAKEPRKVFDRIRHARVLIIGLEPWGSVAAIELARSGVGSIDLLDHLAIVEDDLLLVRSFERRHLGRSRSEAVQDVIGTLAPWCKSVAKGWRSSEDLLGISDDKWDLILTALSKDDIKLLRSVAVYAHRTGNRVLYGWLDGLDAIVGPLVVPGETACWNCVHKRLLANTDRPAQAQAIETTLLTQSPGSRRRAYLGPTATHLGAILALETLKIVSGYTQSTMGGRILVQNLVTLETSTHLAIRLPWCEVCGRSDCHQGTPGGPVPAHFTDDPLQQEQRGLSEARDPDELRRLLRGVVDPKTGIVRHLVVNAADPPDPELPVTSSALVSSDPDTVCRHSQPELGSGKGLSVVEAMVGAVGEAVERYSASRWSPASIRRAAYNEITGSAFDPRDLCLYEEDQYADPGFPFSPFDPQRPIDWTPGQWLDTRETVWVPALATYLNYRASPEEQLCQVTTSGLASGANLDDAIMRALFELAERDAFMLTWLAQLPTRPVIVDDALEQGLREVLRQLQAAGASTELYLLDVGLPVPTVACLALGDGRSWPGLTAALGAHVDPRLAVRKAILEQGHVGPYIRRLMVSEEVAVPGRKEDVRTLLDHAMYYTVPERARTLEFFRHSSLQPTSIAEMPTPNGVTLRELAQGFRAAGVRVAAVDVTSPDLALGPFRVARALGTRMQPIHFGFGLERLKSPRLKEMARFGINRHPHPIA